MRGLMDGRREERGGGIDVGGGGRGRGRGREGEEEEGREGKGREDGDKRRNRGVVKDRRHFSHSCNSVHMN